MCVKLTKTYDFIALLVSAEFVNLETKMPFFLKKSAALSNVNKFCDIQLTVAFRNGKLEYLRFFTEKGADISVRDSKNNSTVHFAAVAYSVDINKLLLGIKTYVKLTDKDDENPLHISAEFGNLETWKAFFLLKRFSFEEG